MALGSVGDFHKVVYELRAMERRAKMVNDDLASSKVLLADIQQRVDELLQSTVDLLAWIQRGGPIG